MSPQSGPAGVGQWLSNAISAVVLVRPDLTFPSTLALSNSFRAFIPVPGRYRNDRSITCSTCPSSSNRNVLDPPFRLSTRSVSPLNITSRDQSLKAVGPHMRFAQTALTRNQREPTRDRIFLAIDQRISPVSVFPFCPLQLQRQSVARHSDKYCRAPATPKNYGELWLYNYHCPFEPELDPLFFGILASPESYSWTASVLIDKLHATQH